MEIAILNREEIDKRLKTPKLSKQERLAKEKKLLIHKLAANNFKEIRPRVAYILNHYPETRNSDILLSFKYWRTFQPEHLSNDGSVNQSKMFKLERQVSLVRVRAKIQNEYGLFLADKEIRKKRFSLEEKEKEEQLADKPGFPNSTFYLDESGKTQKYVIVGGLCFSDGLTTLKMTQHLRKWKEDQKITYELHFTEMRKNNLDAYKNFFAEALGFSDTSSFKVIALYQKGIKNKTIEDIVRELYYQLIHKSMEHENETGRASYPRTVTVFKDKEDGSNLFMISLEQELKTGFNKHFNNELTLSLLDEINSSGNPLIQLADLYIGSISRILNRGENAEFSHKDEFADYVVELLGINLNNNNEEPNQDQALVEIF